jgi:tRNA modification GTPase
MKFLYSDEPIIACSTSSQTHAALAVLRISGLNDLSSLQKFFKINLGPIEPRRVYFTQLVSEVGEFIDEICLTWFKGPHSFNAENILELSVHGNTLNIERILKLFIHAGICRTALPGEFTYRALKNKKLTLSQVEGLDLFLNANSDYALRQGLSLLNGDLHQSYSQLYDLFLKHKASLELSIDFSEDVGESTAQKYFHESLKELHQKIEELHRRVMPLSQNLIQPEIVLVGLPNAGKSSLFNYFLRQDRAIVSAIAGTTRDYITELIDIEGVKYKLIDTAGIREGKDVIESEGIKRSLEKAKHSFFTILLINPFETSHEFFELEKVSYDVAYFTHSDKAGFNAACEIFKKHHPTFGSIGALNTKKLTQNDESEIFNLLNKKYLLVTEGKPILLDRHKGLILQALKISKDYFYLSANETDAAILSYELNTLGHCLSELIGIISPDQVLNSIFSNFCIGK